MKIKDNNLYFWVWEKKNFKENIIQLLGEIDAKQIKEHKYFSDVDWNKYMNKEIEPPFIPGFEGEQDLKYFDKMFTDEPVNSNRTTIMSRSNATSEYNGFTYTAQSVEKDIIEIAKNDEEQNL